MARSKTSSAWLNEHVHDHWVQRAKAEGYRARAAFKLLEIDEKDRLLRPGEVVVDLGAAPGSWSQVAAAKVGAKGKVFALDLLDIEPLPGVRFLQGDFREEAVLTELEQRLEGAKVGVVLSDMAPNTSGMASIDQPRMMYLVELALDFARQHLKPDGAFLVKCFQGEGYPEYLKAMRDTFATVATRKPKASRDRSVEIYLLGKGLKR
ncbi:23S rRNA (uridine(2552)-2'-O)-methyltransferase RlmE [Oryzomicrobium sp.]|uniref:23S rRNA (uridine(2552)-2'-O)-methyltransferase RlmE n=1 Tax=Oryzomicrobium sp. TaxID=1911578 RepID=UPI0025EC785F|nr:23S rRNA (uridine(2552)-2'-O)-methyltransferase RlmE [Oryzomicrobium sp.]MCE1244599.1 23S rRNA (uridine(2552)-2'-O)-methyltransferase RlmE [Oryzomicrobium sp.]